jgi:hypothetical protein
MGFVLPSEIGSLTALAYLHLLNLNFVPWGCAIEPWFLVSVERLVIVRLSKGNSAVRNLVP